MTAAASELAYHEIRNMLTRGELSPGQRLSQSRLARQFQCSPMPVVEAMRRLESEGLLEKQARKQARVRRLSLGDLEGLYLLREALETVIARLAALRITPEEAQKLQELARTYERAWETQDHEAEADVALHHHVAQCARCPLLESELGRLRFRTDGRTSSGRGDSTGPPAFPSGAGPGDRGSRRRFGRVPHEEAHSARLRRSAV